MSNQQQQQIIQLKRLACRISKKFSDNCPINRLSLEKFFELMSQQYPQFQDYDYLDDGAQSLVLKARNVHEQRDSVLKVIDSSNKKQKRSLDAMKKEFEFLKKVSYSKHVVKVFDCIYVYDENYDYLKNNKNAVYQNQKENIFLVIEMEVCEVEIYKGHYLWKKKGLNRTTKLHKIIEICLKKDYKNRKSVSELLEMLIEMHQEQLPFQIYSIFIESQIEKQVDHIIEFYDSQVQEKFKKFKFKRENLIMLISQLFKKEQYNRSFQIIGFGAQGIILATFNKKTQKDIVLKIQEIHNQELINNEINIMKMVQMSLIVEFYSHYYLKGLSNRYVVYELERCNFNFQFKKGSLQNYLDKQKKEKEINEEEKMLISCQIISVVNYIHSLGIIHNDLKPDNFLIKYKDNQIQVKLTDFGCAIKLDKQNFIETDENLGTFLFWAPETYHDVKNKRIYSKKSDTFSVGLVLCLVDNYFAFNQDQNIYPLSYYNMIESKFILPFDPQAELDKKDKLNRNSKIYKFIKDFLVYQQETRKDLLYHIKQSPQNFLPILEPKFETLKIKQFGTE
ncbi:hypothetical protein ABPG72_017689 [Tetrahymena utriculariae]